MKYLYAILIAGALFGFYIWMYISNHNTPVPAGCENLKPDCEACKLTSCSVRNEIAKRG